MPLTFISFGSGSCGNCYYLGTETDAIIIDAGISFRRLKKVFGEYGVKKGNIRALLITHDHSDHIKAAGLFSDECELPVYTTLPIHDGMDRNIMMNRKINAARRVYVEEEEPFQIADFQITPFQIPHDATENMGYSIQYGDIRFTIMTDVGAVTPNVSKYISLSTHVVLEANYDADMLRMGRYPEDLKKRISSGTGHLSNAETAQALLQNIHPALRHVWLCHLSEENNRPDLAHKTVEFLLRSYGIVAGTDFQLDVLRRKDPTGPFYINEGTIPDGKGTLF